MFYSILDTSASSSVNYYKKQKDNVSKVYELKDEININIYINSYISKKYCDLLDFLLTTYNTLYKCIGKMPGMNKLQFDVYSKEFEEMKKTFIIKKSDLSTALKSVFASKLT